MSNLPIRQLRLRPFADADLDEITGSRGEVYFDTDAGTLRLYNGTAGGQGLLRDDLSNVRTTALNTSINFGTGTVSATQFIGAGIGAVLGDSPPVAPVAQSGTLWFNTSTGKLYIYYNDGNSLQWVQPMTPSVGGGSGGSGSGSGTVSTGVGGKLAYYAANGTTVDDLAQVSYSSNTLNVTGSIGVTGQKNYVRFHWDTLDDLNAEAPAASWHGMIAHVHSTGKLYYAHAGAWTALANQSELGAGITNILAGENITLSNNSGVFTINAVVGGGGGGITLEQAQDGTATLFQNGTQTGISFVYSDAGNAISATVADVPLGTRTTGSYVASLATGSGLTGGAAASETAVLTLGIDSTVVCLLSSAQTLTNKTINATNNSITNIANAALINSSITINGTAVNLGGTIAVSAGASTLDGLSDVTITSAAVGQVLKYNGSIWINDADATAQAGSASDSFATIVVAGQSSVIADSSTDTLTLAAGTGITLTTNASTDTITINNSLAAANVFSVVAVAGQSNVEADTATDTLTLAAGTNISITTNASTDTITINSTAAAGATTFAALTDTAGLTVDQFYLPAITRLGVIANGSSSYSFDQYSGSNPTIYAISGTTMAFDLSVGQGSHPFLIRFSGTNYNTGLTHVTSAGIVTTGSSAQAKTSGTLYWKIPANISGNYQYQCSNHGSMAGIITIKDIAAI